MQNLPYLVMQDIIQYGAQYLMHVHYFLKGDYHEASSSAAGTPGGTVFFIKVQN